MADEAVLDPEEEKKQIREEKKALKKEQKAAQKEAKARAKEIAKREDELDDDDAGGLSIAMVTIIIIVIWIAILALLIKLDVGGLGSTVMRPLIKDVPVLNAILPAESSLGSNLETTAEEDPYMGFTSLDEAVAYIRQLEREMSEMQNNSGNDSARVEALEAEIERLQTFEKAQVEFQRIKDEFYNEVIYAENGPGIEQYKKYYESIDPEKAEALYQQVIMQVEKDKEMEDYVAAYSAMKPKEAAKIFEAMTDNLALAARILENMDSDSRGKILGAMDQDVAAKITKLMDPEG
ncbi:MgtE intracellular N domain-containing protein [Lachnospiraceae bacterium XBB2008]|nr:MgtE intracellular N domain-containing protein [Lachnospiraceae bacterium XBB2008]